MFVGKNTKVNKTVNKTQDVFEDIFSILMFALLDYVNTSDEFFYFL